MPLIPIELPPGLKDNGTDLQARGRWNDANLVRWREGVMSPVGGWTERTTTGASTSTPPRGAVAWQDNSGDRRVAFGSFDKLYAMTSGNVISNITPTSFTSGREDAVVNTGYGGSTYDTGAYGQARPDDGVYLEATTWALDNYGQDLVGCSSEDGKIVKWPRTGVAAAISGAPTDCSGLVVTEERFIFALGAGGDSRKVQWCDFEDDTTWTPASTNQAGSQILQSSGSIMLGVSARGQTLIITEIDAHRALYAGPPLVYQFEKVGAACGAISRKCAVDTEAGVFWMGQKSFFFFNGSTVQTVPCEIRDRIFLNMNNQQKSKIWAMAVSEANEVWWFYPSAGSSEIDQYVSYNFEENHWSAGALARSAGVDRGVFEYPIMFEPEDAEIYDHEVGYNYDSATIFAESGPIYDGSGERLLNVKSIIPDERAQGDVSLTFKSRNYPNSTETSHGPYTLANPTSVRFQGRQVRMRVEGAKATEWRVGVFRADVSQAGRRG